MAKKFLLVTVGGVRDVTLAKNENGEVASIESIDGGMIQMNNASVMDVIKHSLEDYMHVSMETEQLDASGVGTGIGKNILADVQKIAEMKEVAAISELKSAIHSEVKEQHTPIVVLGNDIVVKKEDEKTLDALVEDGVAVYTVDEMSQVVDTLAQEHNVVAEDATCEPSQSGMDAGEPEIDLGALVGEPGKSVSEETEQKQKEYE